MIKVRGTQINKVIICSELRRGDNLTQELNPNMNASPIPVEPLHSCLVSLLGHYVTQFQSKGAQMYIHCLGSEILKTTLETIVSYFKNLLTFKFQCLPSHFIRKMSQL